MNVYEQAVAELEKKFNVVGIVSLNDTQLYQRLQELYRSKFDINDKIIVIQNSADVYDYLDLPGQQLIDLQQYLRQIDISNCFVSIISGNNIETEISQIRDLYASDDVCIDFLKVNDNIDPAAAVKKDTFCPLPWMHLYVGPDGNVLPCCVADHQYPLGNINEKTPITIANSESFIQLRNNMLAGQRSKECAYCYQKEDAGLPSLRQDHIKRWTVNTTEKFNPVYLDIRLNNICNLKCRMCSSYFSSAIAQEDAELYGKSIAVGGIMKNRRRKLALEEIIEFLPTAEKIYFAGGEPLLAPEHYKILDHLVACGNTDLEIFYNTNFTRLQFRDVNVTDQWKKFSNVTIGASIDAMGSVAEYIRHGTIWKDIKYNVDQVTAQCPHVNLTVTSTVGLLNIESLVQLQKSWHLNQQLDISKFSLTVMISPNHLTVGVLPIQHKKRLDSIIADHVAWCRLEGANSLASQWDNVLSYMWNNDFSHYLTEFKRLTKIQDTNRNESFKSVFPMYQDLL